jgi:hypothetical protein
MDGVTLVVLGVGAGVILLVILLASRTRPFRGTGRSGADHEAGAWTWIGADHRHSGKTDHGGNDGGADGGGSGSD